MIIPKIQSRVYWGELTKALFSRKTIADFEHLFKRHISRKHCYATYSGRSALIAILRSLNLHKGDEIIMPGFTFMGLGKIIEEMDYIPVLADVSPETLNIIPEKIGELVTPRTKVLLVVHNLGNPNDMDKIKRICNKHNLFLIEDCAHTLNSTYKGKKLGTFGDASFFSFHYSKVINTYWGGMVCTDDDKLAGKIRGHLDGFKPQTRKDLGMRLAVSIAQSMVTDTLFYPLVFYWLNRAFKKIKGKDIMEALFKLKPKQVSAHTYQFSDFQATIGIEQMKKLPKFTHMRLEYKKMFEEEQPFKTQQTIEEGFQVPLMLTIMSDSKEKVMAHLEKNRIEARDFYIPSLPEMFPAYRHNCTQAKEIEDRIIYFPTFHLRKKKDMEFIIKKLRDLD